MGQEGAVFLLGHAFCRVLYNNEEVFAIYVNGKKRRLFLESYADSIMYKLAGSDHDLVFLCSHTQKC